MYANLSIVKKEKTNKSNWRVMRLNIFDKYICFTESFTIEFSYFEKRFTEWSRVSIQMKWNIYNQ